MSAEAGEFQSLLDSPDWLCQQLDLLSEQALFVEVDAETCRRSMFLDQRLAVTAAPRQQAVPLWPMVRALARSEAMPVHWIFHMGHCGSTLISRLLEALQPGQLALREPLPLLTLVTLWRQLDDDLSVLDPARFAPLERSICALLARRYEPALPTQVKATSDCLPLAARLLALHTDSRALGIELSLERYLQVMLRNPVRRSELMGHSQARLADLRLKVPASDLRIYRLSPGQLAAMSWLSLQLWLEAAVAEGALRLNFDQFLARPADTLARVCNHLQFAADPSAIERVLASGISDRYAKDPGQPFDAEARQAQLAESARSNAEEIRAGIAWAESMAAQWGLERLSLQTCG